MSTSPAGTLETLYGRDNPVGKDYQRNPFVVNSFEKSFGGNHDGMIGPFPCVGRELPTFSNYVTVMEKCRVTLSCEIILDFNAPILLQAINNSSLLREEILSLDGIGEVGIKRPFVYTNHMIAVMRHVS
jgi:hypothetical protein